MQSKVSDGIWSARLRSATIVLRIALIYVEYIANRDSFAAKLLRVRSVADL